MTTVITGASGHLGRLVIDQLLAAGTPPAQIEGQGARHPDLEMVGKDAAPIDVMLFAIYGWVPWPKLRMLGSEHQANT